MPGRQRTNNTIIRSNDNCYVFKKDSGNTEKGLLAYLQRQDNFFKEDDTNINLED